MKAPHLTPLLLAAPLVLSAQSRDSILARCEPRLRSQLEASRSGDRTFKLDLTATDGARLRYFGSRHTNDTADAQIAEIDSIWRAFRPTVAFYEGTGTFIGPTAQASVARSEEAGLVRFLAKRDSVPARTLEPTAAEEVQALLGQFTAEQLALFYVTRPLTQYRDGAQRGAAAYTRAQLDSILQLLVTRVLHADGLSATLPDTAAYHRAFPGVNPLDTPAGWFDPEHTSAETGSKFMNDVNRASSAFRDLHMYRLLASATSGGARVFAVVGRSHVPAQ